MTKISLPVLALAALLPAAALAQQQQDPQQQQQQQQALNAQADNIVGKKAMNQQGKEVGEIEGALVGQDGRIQAVVIEHGGKKRAVSWQSVKLQGDQVTITMSEQQMSQLPEYSEEKE